jgi:Protein of unknown function (DUF2924)
MQQGSSRLKALLIRSARGLAHSDGSAFQYGFRSQPSLRVEWQGSSCSRSFNDCANRQGILIAIFASTIFTAWATVTAGSSNRQFLFRRIAWRLQANAHGDLSERARHRALEIADDADLASVRRRVFWRILNPPKSQSRWFQLQGGGMAEFPAPGLCSLVSSKIAGSLSRFSNTVLNINRCDIDR